MKYFLDTEFIERGRHYPIELISIGIAAEDGREFYAVSSEFNPDHASDWVKDNVLPQVSLGGDPYLRVSEIAGRIIEFIGQDKPEFWGYYADYDWVVFCQMFGSMVDLPRGWPMYCLDLKQYCKSQGNPPLPAQGKGEHNALLDAKWNRGIWKFLFDYQLSLRMGG